MRLAPSQIIIVATVLVFLVYAFRLRTLLRDRVIFAVIVGLGVALALYPDFSTRVANAIGIGRGADLLLYVFLLFSLFYNVHLAARLKNIESQIRSVVREQALATVGAPIDRVVAVAESSAAERAVVASTSPRAARGDAFQQPRERTSAETGDPGPGKDDRRA
jgi:hypothetical protein